MVRVIVFAVAAGALVSASDTRIRKASDRETVPLGAGATGDVDCELSAWVPQDCDALTLTQVFKRTVITEVAGSGRPCDDLTETRPCTPVDCQLSVWSPWSGCQEDGYSVRTRHVLKEPQYGGRACPPLVDRVVCADSPAPISAMGLSSAVAASKGLSDTEDQRRLAGVVAFPSELKALPNSDSFHMGTVRVVQARVQSDKPKWNADNGVFGSTYYSDFEGSFRGLLDTVNTASVEGALMYVQAEGINEAVRGATDRCRRKNNMKYVVFYDIVLAQTNETLALYEAEYGKLLAMDGGQCTPSSGSGDTAVFPEECYLFNGDKGRDNVGPFVGGEARDTDERAPYPNTWWYSFPNSCPLQKWGSAKTDACRHSTRTGLCDYDTKPDGIKCTFNYRVLGWIPLDDLVGITSMTNTTTGVVYANFSQFCNDGNVEFKGTINNTWIDGIDFWKDPRDTNANAARADKLVRMYNNAIAGSVSLTQVSSADLANFKALPTVADLRAANPPCYKHVKACASALYGCKRSLYGQICTVCAAEAPECVAAPSSFTFPQLVVKQTKPPATAAPTPSTAAVTPDSTVTPDPTVTPSPTPSTASKSAASQTTKTKKSAAAATSVVSLATAAAIFMLGYMLF